MRLYSYKWLHIKTLLLQWVFLCCCCIGIANGQDYLHHSQQLSVEQGLSNRFVRAIIEDDLGFLWVGTQHGLNRYDGSNFQIFTQEREGLQGNFVNALNVDADGYLWVGYTDNDWTRKEVSVIDIIDPKTLSVTPIQDVLGAFLPCKVSEIYKIYQAPKGSNLYLLTTFGAIYEYLGGGNFQLLYQDKSRERIKDILIGTKYTWVYCNDHVIALDSTGKLQKKQWRPSTQEDEYTSFIGEKNASTIWLEQHNGYDYSGIYAWDITENTLLPAQFSYFGTADEKGKAEYCFYGMAEERLLKSRKAIYFFGANDSLFFKYEPKEIIQTCYVDRQNNVWLAESAAGLIKIDHNKKQFNTYLQGISTRGITTLNQDSTLLIATYKGRYWYNTSTQQTTYISEAGGYVLLPDHQRQVIWVGQGSKDLLKVSMSKMDPMKVYNCYNDKQGLNPTKLFRTLLLNEDRLWAGTARGLAYIDFEQDTLMMFKHHNEFKLIEESIINFLYQNEAGIWAATSTGLYQIDPLKGVQAHYYQQATNKKEYLPANYLNYIHEDQQGNFWMTTRGAGLICWHPQHGVQAHYTTDNLLSHNVTYGILEDELGYFWVSSDYGLMQIDPVKEQVKLFLEADGLPHEEFNQGSFYKDKNNHFYFGGLGGIVAFNPKTINAIPQQEATLALVQFQRFNESEGILLDKTQEVLEQQKIILQPQDRYFVVEVALLDYRINKKIRYAYKIEGFDEVWNYIDNDRFRINNLGPGNYTLKIKAQDLTGSIYSKELIFEVQVLQPFYQTWQFAVLIVLISLVIILAYSRWRVLRLERIQANLEAEVSKRTQQIAAQADELRALDRVKSQFFANISHELRTPLTLILGPVTAMMEGHYSKDYQQIEQILKVVQRNGIQLKELIEEILILSKVDAHQVALEPEVVAFLPLLRRVLGAYEAQAALQAIHLSLEYDLADDLHLTVDRRKLEKIINNLLSNALKHTPRDGKITLKVQQLTAGTQLQLLIEIIDTGKGIHEKDLPHVFERFYQSKQSDAILQGGTGIGLALSSEFARLLGGTLTVESQLGEGSTFRLRVPLEVATAVESLEEIDAAVENETLNGVAIAVPTDSIEPYHILVAEDHDDMRQFVQSLLLPYGQVHTVENGWHALEWLKNQEKLPDLIVSDIMMPEIDGITLLTQLKNTPKWQAIPVIMLTARANEQDKLQALRIGVDDYLKKPFSPQELMVRALNLMQNHRQRQAWKLELEQTVATTTDTTEQTEITTDLANHTSDEWLLELEAIVRKEAGNNHFGITSLAYALHLSERQLRRRIKLKTGLTPNQYMRSLKLSIAREYLEERRYQTVAEVAHQVGFSNAHYFSKLYQEAYGRRPIEYLKSNV